MSVANILQLLTGVTTLITAIGVAVVAVRSSMIKDVQRIGLETHTMVNSRMDAMMALLEKQRTALQSAGIPIPLDDSIPDMKK